MKVSASILAGMFCALFAAGSVPAVEMGELDTSFGKDGRVATSVGHFEDQAHAVTVQADGRILVGGSSSNGSNLDFALVRYYEDGSLDRSFNFDGTVTTQVGRDDDEVAAIAVQDDGYIIAAGYSINGGSSDFALARYTPDGEPDYSFGQGGVVIDDYGRMDDEITALAVDREGRIVVAGYTTGTRGRAVVLARYLSSGAPDLSFGDDGVSLTGIGDDALARSIAVDDSDRILVAGSYTYAQRTEVMVLRFTEDGELDSDFGTDGLALASPGQVTTEGFGVTVHESGAVLVAGSVGAAGDRDAALFLFDETGRPQADFGTAGMLVTEVSQDDDMALAVDVQGDVISLSGFSSIDAGDREFLFITHQVEVSQVDRVSFSLKTGSNTTSLWIGERQVYNSYNEFQAAPMSGAMEVVRTVVNTTPFGYFSDDISYAIDLQPDGKAVAAGLTEQGGVTSFAVVRYGAADAALEMSTSAVAAGVSWLTTKDPTEVTRTGAFTGGIINKPGMTIKQRGVVFSIAPDPTVSDATDSPDNPPGGGDTTPPVISGGVPSGELPAGTTSTTLGVTTNENATCRYSKKAGTDYDSMSLTFDTTGGTSHQEPVTGLVDGTSYIYYVRCKDAAGNKSSSDFSVSFSVASGAAASGLLRVERYAETLGNFLVGTAHAQTVDPAPQSTGSVFDLTTPQFLVEGQTKDGAGPGSYSSILTNLKPGTFFYLRAYAITDSDEVFYGNQLGFKTADSCFIATAAYGSLFHPYVKILREFRDQYLVSNLPGRLFVNAYYRFSPPAADFITRHPLARRLTQIGLLPVVGLGWLITQFGALVLLAAGTAFVSGVYVHRVRRRKDAL